MSDDVMYTQKGRYGMPVDGPAGTLAGIAEPGARLDVTGRTDGGSFVNRGTKAAPRWERLYDGTETPYMVRRRGL